MTAVQLSSSETVAHRLQRLAKLYEHGHPSATLERALDKLLDYEAETCRKQLAELQQDLASFEQRYSLASSEFYRQFQAGQTDDRMDYVEWASLFQMYTNLEERLKVLAGEEPE
jgi:hypothetical protein